MASAFEPEFAGNWTLGLPAYPVGETSSYPSIGLGVFVDVKLSHWVQIEAEGRWLRFNQDPNIFQDSKSNVHQDNYLIGPRVPLPRIWRASPYAKVLAGYSLMNLGLPSVLFRWKLQRIRPFHRYCVWRRRGFQSDSADQPARIRFRISVLACVVEFQPETVWGEYGDRLPGFLSVQQSCLYACAGKTPA